ncbi:hypothetical protein [Cellulomonas telluris]|uniref:hypothetical protein n=1 Tax=Cellulomonas telluris TaxID=2306636 RepID=UPI0010A7CDE5|nr:hypothetical protein [Cellulomonas telluris]
MDDQPSEGRRRTGVLVRFVVLAAAVAGARHLVVPEDPWYDHVGVGVIAGLLWVVGDWLVNRARRR